MTKQFGLFATVRVRFSSLMLAGLIGVVLAGCGGGGGGTSSGVSRSRLLGTWEASRISYKGESVSCADGGEIALGDEGATASCSAGDVIRFADNGDLQFGTAGEPLATLGEWRLDGSRLIVTVDGNDEVNARLSLSGDTLRVVLTGGESDNEYTSEYTRR